MQPTLFDIVREAQKDEEVENKTLVMIANGHDTQGWSVDSKDRVLKSDKLYVPLACRDKVLRKFQNSQLVVHPSSTKMFMDLLHK